MNEPQCDDVFAKLSEYLDGQLPESACAELEKHLQGCPPCIEFLASLRRSVELCRQYGGECRPSEPAPEQVTQLRQAYHAMLARRRAAQ
jgi:anti-sigma factor RsiW